MRQRQERRSIARAAPPPHLCAEPRAPSRRAPPSHPHPYPSPPPAALAQGPWEHPTIPNPEYVDDESIGKYASFGVVAFELWQVKAGTIFDNLLITDDVAEAEALRKATWEKSKDGEKAMFDKIDADKKKAEDEKAKEAGEGGEGDEDEEPEEPEPNDDKDEV